MKKAVLIILLATVVLAICSCGQKEQKEEIEAQAVVPNLVGMDMEQACEEMKESKLIPGDISYVYDDSAKDNSVIEQFPAPETVTDVGAAVDIKVVKKKDN